MFIIFNRVNIDKIKEKLTIDMIKTLVLSLGADIHDEDDKQLQLSSICHNSNSHKLYYFKATKSFYCFSKCSHSYSVFDLVMKMKSLNFPQSIQYICNTCDIPYESTIRLTEKNTNIDDWKSVLNKYNRYNSTHSELKIYDKRILGFFPKVYHEDWLNEGISIETMDLFGIRFYPFRQQIVIPVFNDENELIGIRGRNLIPESIEFAKYIPIQLLQGEPYKFPTNMVLYGINITKQAIQSSKRVVLVEGEKSVMKMQEFYGKDNNSVALFGGTLGKFRRDYLIKLGIEVVTIVADNDFTELGSQEHIDWEKKILKLADNFRGYCRVEIVWDNLRILGYKDNATDYDKETYERLYESREEVIWEE